MRSGILATRRLLALVCALLFALALAGCGAVGAQPGVSSPAGPDGPPVEEEGGYGAAAEPEAGYLIVDEAITQGGSCWMQPEGYRYYRVSVANNGGEALKVTVTYGGAAHCWEKTVAANTEEMVLNVVNAADGWEHNISFSTPSGELDGTVQVRVSDTEL